MDNQELEKDLRKITLMIALLKDAVEKYGNKIKTIDTRFGFSPQALKSADDLNYLYKKKKYLEFLLAKNCV